MIREIDPGETSLAYAAMLELRPNIGQEIEFVQRVNQSQRAEGYRLIGVFRDGAGGRGQDAVAVAGFRRGHYLAWGHVLYCDDLSTRAQFRGQGHAGALIDWMIAEARRSGCDEFHLDSGVGSDRQQAHRLYLNKRMRISAHHFALDLRGRRLRA